MQFILFTGSYSIWNFSNLYCIFNFILSSLNFNINFTLDQVDSLDKYLSDFALVKILSMITFLQTIYDIVLILTELIPSFGLLIHTFTVAKRDILVFTCVNNIYFPDYTITIYLVYAFDYL